MRLNRLRRNLVGKDFALLIRNRLPVHGEGVFRVVAQTVEQSIRVGRNPRGGQCHERTDRRGLTLQGHVLEQSTVHIRVKG